nr:hypothetical protein GW17_00028899 [Ipomoea batatas]
MQVHRYSDNLYRSFSSREEAVQAFNKFVEEHGDLSHNAETSTSCSSTSISKDAQLFHGNNAPWEVDVQGLRFSTGWVDFCEALDIKLEDDIVFQHMGFFKFQFFIFRNGERVAVLDAQGDGIDRNPHLEMLDLLWVNVKSSIPGTLSLDILSECKSLLVTSYDLQYEPGHLLSFIYNTESEDEGSEILALEGLAELPIGGCHVPRGDLATVAGSDPEGEGLAHKEGAGLPILPPVPGQSDPWGSGSLNQDLLDITRTRHVGHQHQVKKHNRSTFRRLRNTTATGISESRKPKHGFSGYCYAVWITIVPSRAPFRHINKKKHETIEVELPVMLNEREKWRRGLPAEINRDDPGTVGSDLEEHGHCEVEVGARGVAPPAIVVGKGEIRRAEVCSGDEDGRVSRAARSVVGALDLKAGSAAQPIVEQRSAQRVSAAVKGSVGALPGAAGVNAGDSSMNSSQRTEEKSNAEDSKRFHFPTITKVLK